MNDQFVLLNFCISIGIIVFIWRYGFEPLRRDEFRSRLRVIRDELFDFMWKNGLDYQDAEYQKTRNTLNALIGMTGTLSPMTIIVAFFLSVKEVHEDKSEVVFLTDNQNIKIVTASAIKKATEAMICFLFLQGALGVFVRFITLFLRAIHVAQQVKQVAVIGANYIISNASTLVMLRNQNTLRPSNTAGCGSPS